MTARYEIFAEADLKYVRISGETHLQELRALAEAYHSDARFSYRAQLVDLSRLEEARAGFKDVMTLRNFYLRTFGPVDTPFRVAIAAPTDLGFGIARMFYMLMLGSGLMDIKIFNDLPDACSWLQVRMSEGPQGVHFSPAAPGDNAVQGAP